MSITVGQVVDAVYDRYPNGQAPTIDGGINLGAIILTVIDVLDEMGLPVGIERPLTTREPMTLDYEYPLTGGVRIVDPNRPGHQEVQIFVGRNPGARASAGKVTLRVEDVDWFLAQMQAAGFDVLDPTWPDGEPE